MLMRALQHIRQVWLQSPSINMCAIATIIAILQTQEVIVNIAQIVKHIAETDILGVFAELKLVCSAILFLLSFSHGLSRITPLTPTQWEADTLPSGNAVHVCQRDAYIKPQFMKKVKCFFQKRCGLTHEGGLSSRYLKVGVSSPYFR